MMNKHGEPFIYINFVDASGNTRHWQFKSPIEVIVAESIKDVIPCLNKVQTATERGFFVAGFLSYEAAAAFHKDITVHQTQQIPLLWFGVFEQPTAEPLTNTQPFTISDWLPHVSKETYGQNVDRILKAIQKGETEQVNYTIPFHACFSGDARTYYNQLKEAQSAHYSAYINIGHTSILSASPELFFHLDKNIITTRPMKGTVARGKTYAEDTYLSQRLQTSRKNRHENKLIVELMKQELAAIAKQNTVKTTRLYDVEKYPTVWQMTSTITAELEDNKNLSDIFQSLFPCGSITGQPKRKTMNVITELENTPRDIYCGTIGFMTPQQEAIFNVPIRTVTVNHETGLATYNAGGAITKESTKEDEYEEVLAKKKILTKKVVHFQLLESFGLENGTYIVMAQHLKRLEASALYFNFNIDLTRIREALDTCARKHPNGYWKVRLSVYKNGTFNLKPTPIELINDKVPVAVADKPISDDLFLYHKTTNRTIYEAHKIKSAHIFDTLLWNEHGYLTEFTIGNLVVQKNGKYYTPPVSAGLLPGTFRADLLNRGIIMEHPLKVEDLKNCTAIWLINSVRKWVPVYLHQ